MRLATFNLFSLRELECTRSLLHALVGLHGIAILRKAWVNKQLIKCAEVRQKLQHSFHWFEVYLGILTTLIVLAGIAILSWERQQRRLIRERWRTKDNLEANVDGKYLAKLLGDVLLLDDTLLVPTSVVNPC